MISDTKVLERLFDKYKIPLYYYEMAKPQFIDKYVKFLKEFKVNQTIKEMDVDFD